MASSTYQSYKFTVYYIMCCFTPKFSLRLLCLCLFFPLTWTCTPQYPPNIPQVQVDITLFLGDPFLVNLQGVGGSVEIPGGSRGILLYRASIDQFNAYELHCPYAHTDACGKVHPDQSGLFLVDDSCDTGAGCGSRFNIINGQVEAGPATYPLVQYNTNFDGQATLRIFN